jgi:hypothetical protein
MNINFMNFALTMALLQRKGVSSQRATELGLLSSFVPGPMGLIVGVLAADREAPPAPPPEEKQPPARVRP